MKKEYTFLLLNSIIYGVSWNILSVGLVYNNSNVIQSIAIIALLITIFFEFGGEFIITLICTYKFNFRFDSKLFVFSLIASHSIPKILAFNINYFFIVLFFINQILGFMFGVMLRNKKEGDIF